MQGINSNSPEEMKNKNTKDQLPDAVKAEAAEEAVISDDLALKYQKAVAFMESVKCMTPCKDKVKMYKRAAAQFADLGAFLDSEILMKKCKRKAKKVKEEIIKNTYERALYHKERAKAPEDYKRAADEFRKAKGYQDAEEQALTCDGLSTSMEKRGMRKRFLQWGIAVLCIFLFLVGLKAPYTKYMVANISMATGSYHFAEGLYDKLGAYRDSEEKILESRYRNGLSLEKKGDYADSLEIFAGLKDYRNSRDKAEKLEKQVLKSSAAGDIVIVGDVDWVVLELRDQQALLFKKTGLKDIPFHNVPEAVTWETSQLREYLNDNYIKENFSSQEQKNIIPTSVENKANTKYGTDGGNDTKDAVYILSTEEVRKYSKWLPVLNIDTWLRTPGCTQNSASFFTADGKIMDYGYDVSGNQIMVHPVMWYDFGDNQ